MDRLYVRHATYRDDVPEELYPISFEAVMFKDGNHIEDKITTLTQVVINLVEFLEEKKIATTDEVFQLLCGSRSNYLTIGDIYFTTKYATKAKYSIIKNTVVKTKEYPYAKVEQELMGVYPQPNLHEELVNLRKEYNAIDL